MFVDKILTAIFGTQNDRDVKALRPILAKVNEKEEKATNYERNKIRRNEHHEGGEGSGLRHVSRRWRRG